jgi:murein DD-endopeptidase MepM/ murein hydrolase activator NlpD
MRQRGLFRGVHLLAAALVVAACATTRTAAPRYLLPYPVGASCVLLQGNNGPWGHEGKAAFAYDFAMPIGSRVAAARDGVVVKVEGRYEDGNHKPGWENFIFVAHGDGTFGRYYHLTKDGPIVAAGDRVRAGDWIGKSGNTGASAGPHLHFDVTTGCPEWGCQTIPISFENSTENPLIADKTYEALPAGRPPPRPTATTR